MDLRNRKIQVSKIKCSDSQILSILPLLDSKSLTSVVLNSSAPINNLNELLCSKSWQGMESLDIQVTVQNLYRRNLIFVKRTLLFSPIFNSFTINFISLQESYLFKYFGHFMQNDGLLESYMHVWKTKRDFLKVSLRRESNQISFSRVKCDTNPNGFSSFDNLEPILLEDVPLEEIGSLGLEVLSNNVIMGNAIQYLDFVDLAALRKVASSIRSCIDQLKPDPQIQIVIFELQSSQKTSVTMHFRNRNPLKILYEETENGCLVNERLVSQSSHKTCLDDLKWNLKSQSCPLDELRIDFHPNRTEVSNLRFRHIIEMTTPFFECFMEAFPTNSLRIQKLSSVFVKESVMLETLAKLQPETLKSIELRTPLISGEVVLVPTTNLVYTEQWKQAREVIMKECLNISPFLRYRFVHLAKLEMIQGNVYDQDLFELKEALLDSPNLSKFKIGFRKCCISENIYNLFGPPYRMENDELANTRDSWYFFMPSRNRILHVVYYKSQCVIFSCVPLDAVPEDAVVIA